MSQRGSFVTEYIYCKNCFAAVRRILLSERTKDLCGVEIPHYDPSHGDGFLPIVAGKIGHLSNEIETLEEFIPDLENALCHPLRIAILQDNETPPLAVTYRIRPSSMVGRETIKTGAEWVMWMEKPSD